MANSTMNTFNSCVEEIRIMITNYKKYPEEIRYPLFIDKLLMIFCIFKGLSLGTFDLDIESVMKENITDDEKKVKTEKIKLKYEQVKECFAVVMQEFYNLQEHFIVKSESHLMRIENKLNEVLMGPDYKEGIIIMKEARDNFNKNIKN